MSKWLAILALTPLLGGCNSINGADLRDAKAWQRCQDQSTQAEISACMATENAVLLAENAAYAAEADSKLQESERRRAIQDAMGNPQKPSND